MTLLKLMISRDSPSMSRTAKTTRFCLTYVTSGKATCRWRAENSLSGLGLAWR